MSLNTPRKLQQNRFHQCRNLDGEFNVQGRIPSSVVLMVEDTVVSKWTLTIGALLLKSAGSGPMFPLALSSSTTGD